MSPLPKKSLKYALFDLAVVASFVAAVHLGWHNFGKAHSIPEQPGSAAIGSGYTAGSDYNATENEPSALIENRRQQQELHRIKLDVTEERTRLRDDLVARASAAARLNVPLTDGEEKLAEDLSEADELLLQIELSDRVLELERLSLPLSAGAEALLADLRGAGPPEQTRLATRYLRDNAARVDEFQGKVAACHALDARLTGRGGELGERYRKTLDEYEQLTFVFEELRSTFEELRTMVRLVQGKRGSANEL